MKILNRSFVFNVLLVFTVLTAFAESLEAKMGKMDRKPSAVAECNLGNVEACHELQVVILQNIRHSQFNDEIREVLEKIISEWKPEAKKR